MGESRKRKEHNMKIKEKIFKRSIIMLAVCLLFYLFWFAVDGVYLDNDSNSYIQGAYSREALYPTILFGFRGLFGEKLCYTMVVLMQCILAALATWKFTMVIDRQFHLNIFSLSVVAFLQLAVVLLCRFAAGRRETYCNSIASEGIAIPLFTLFICELILFAWEKSNKHIILTMVYAICLLSTRKQMYIVIAIMGIIYISLAVTRRINWKKCVIALLSVGAALVLSVGADILYNISLRGEAMRHTTDSSALVISAFFSSDKEEAVYFEDEGLRELFTRIMTEVEEKHYNYKYAGKGWMSLYNHYADNYDLIAFSIVNPAFYEYLDKQQAYTESERERAFDDLNRKMLQTLLPARWQQMLKVTAANMLAGFCNTVSKAHGLLNWYNIVFYLVFGCLMIKNFIKKEDAGLGWLTYIVLVSTVINVGAVGVMIFAQARYMIYNMPFIYVAMYLLLRQIRRKHAF